MNIIITGASRGLGASLVFRFARSPENRIILLSRNQAALDQIISLVKKQAPDANIYNYAADLSSTKDISLFIKKIRDKFNTIDILINNAGALVRKEFNEQDPDDIQRMMMVNYIGPSLLIKELEPLLLNSPHAHVVNISSMGGVQGSVKFPGLSHYSASKAAIAVLTECLAEEYKESRISFNCLAFGAIQTEMLSEAFPGYEAPLSAEEAADYVENFALTAHRYMNGKIIPVSTTTP